MAFPPLSKACKVLASGSTVILSPLLYVCSPASTNVRSVSGSLREVLENLAGGVRAGLGYLGAQDLSELQKNARFIRVTPAGQRESAPHDVVEIKRSDLNRS